MSSLDSPYEVNDSYYRDVKRFASEFLDFAHNYFDDEKILSVPRFDDELIRHKILDAIGDLYLLGPIKAHVIAVKTGHAFNSQIAKQIQAYRTKGE